MLFGKKKINGLNAEVDVTEDKFGVACVFASCEVDAFAVWGFLHARDRFFQMDLMRKKAAGRLSELFGEGALELDKEQRFIDVAKYSHDLWRDLPVAQKVLLEAYTQGVNAAARHTVEHRILRVDIEPWRPTDTILIMLDLFKALAFDLDGALCAETMKESLPDDVSSFLMPDADIWSEVVKDDPAVPLDAFRELRSSLSVAANKIEVKEEVSKGSNGWVIAGNLCCSGNPILANDMHLPLSAPNLWHRIHLQYKDVNVTGIAIPGVPIVLSGANDWLVWGMTNLPGHTVSLEEVENQSRVKERLETFRVLRGREQTVAYYDANGGHVLRERNKIVQWFFKKEASVDFSLHDLAKAKSVEEGVAVARQSACAPINLLLADVKGNIARTIAGRVPYRESGHVDMEREVPSEYINTVINPDSGLLVSANDPVLLKDLSMAGWNHPSSYRRHRIEEKLRESDKWDENSAFELQKDKKIELLDFYRELALESGEAEIVLKLRQWSGFAAKNDSVAVFLSNFRSVLHQEILSFYLAPCVERDPSFQYVWRNPEPAMRALLKERHDETVPIPYKSWNDLIVHALREAEKRDGSSFYAEFIHPLGRSKWLKFFNLMPWNETNNPDCVCSLGNGIGATERLVISPINQKDAIFVMPGGQSGNPFSRHYRDHHKYWITGKTLSFLAGNPVKRWRIYRGHGDEK